MSTEAGEKNKKVVAENCALCGKYPAFFLSCFGKPLCIDCMDKENAKLMEKENAVVSRYKAERVLMLIGMAIGLIISAIVDVLYYKSDNYIVTFLILFPVWITCICGSFISIINKIREELSEEKSLDFLTIMFIVISNIIFSPATLIKRFVKISKVIKETKEEHRKLMEISKELRKEISEKNFK